MIPKIAQKFHKVVWCGMAQIHRLKRHASSASHASTTSWQSAVWKAARAHIVAHHGSSCVRKTNQKIWKSTWNLKTPRQITSFSFTAFAFTSSAQKTRCAWSARLVWCYVCGWHSWFFINDIWRRRPANVWRCGDWQKRWTRLRSWIIRVNCS